jgi:hypothetical protein
MVTRGVYGSSSLVKRESVLFIGTQFSNLYTAVDTPAKITLSFTSPEKGFFFVFMMSLLQLKKKNDPPITTGIPLGTPGHVRALRSRKPESSQRLNPSNVSSGAAGRTLARGKGRHPDARRASRILSPRAGIHEVGLLLRTVDPSLLTDPLLSGDTLHFHLPRWPNVFGI